MGAKPHPRLVRSICGGALGAALAMTPAAAGTTAAASRDAENTSSPHALTEPLRPPLSPFRSPATIHHRDGTAGAAPLAGHRCRADPPRSTDGTRSDRAGADRHARSDAGEVDHAGADRSEPGDGAGAAAGRGAGGHASGALRDTVERRSAFGPRLWTRHGAVAARATPEAESGAEAGPAACPQHGSGARADARHDAKAGERSAGGKVGSAHRGRGEKATRAKQRPSTRHGHRPALRRLNRAPVSASYGLPGSWIAGHHTGVDFAVSVGTPVHSVGKGRVVRAGWSGSYGKSVQVLLDDGYYALYAHLDRIDVEEGAKVDERTRIGLSGNTGRSTGPHLHFEIRAGEDYGTDVDPLNYLRKRGAPTP